ncbi:putative reverse transcriptase domain-containing protein [Tanacetum coccineum]
MSASMEARIAEHAAAPIPPTNPTYNQAPLGHKAAMIRMRDDIPEEDMPPRRRFILTAPPPRYDVAESYAAAARVPRGQYDFVDAVKAGQGLIHSPGHDTRTIARASDRSEDVGYVRRQESEIFYTKLHDARTDRRDIRLEIDVVRSQRTAYETELHEVRQAYLSSKAQNRALLARLETLETHMSRMEIMPVTRQGTNDAMTPESIQAMIDRAIQRNSTQDDESQSIVGLSHWLKKMESIFHISGCAVENQVKFATCTLLGAALTWWNGHKLKIELWNLKVRGNDVAAYTQRFQELTLMCTKFLADETAKIDKYIGGLPDNIHGNVMSVRPKTLDFAIELANHLMDQKLRTYAERQNENKKKADDSSRNNQQPHKKQNVAKAYTAGPGEKKRYGHATTDCRVNTNNNNNNNNNKNQKDGACYKCGNTGHIKKNCPKLKNRRNGNGTDTAQGRAYALGGRDASPDFNVITGTFLLNNRYAMILFDTGADMSFVSNTFSALINITPTTLENHYDVELADGKIIGVNTIIRGCTLNFMNHPFNIDLMPVPLDSFDVIIRMDWLTKYHGVMISA